jgi:uncharacterized protein (TIGR03435 family)
MKGADCERFTGRQRTSSLVTVGNINVFMPDQYPQPSKSYILSPTITTAASGESALATYLEGVLKIPVIGQTGLTQNFDINPQWNRNEPQHHGLKQALLDQPGLELVPTNMPIEMLVVEKASN